MTLSSTPPVERAQPWLGTLVTLRVEGLHPTQAHRAISAAFAEVAQVHQRMSFHHPQSDVSRLNREALHAPTQVHPSTYAVLAHAQQYSRASQGCFDVSVATELVQSGALPAPAHASHSQRGNWRHIQLLPHSRVVFHRPLWIDLGGIAKGYAVDRAAECLARFRPARAVINAGGDLRVLGSHPEPIRLGSPSSHSLAPVLELSPGSVAGSSTAPKSRSVHYDAATRQPVPAGSFACVIAKRCITADALTKIVLAQGKASTSLLHKFSASAWIKDPGQDWLPIATETP